MIPEIDGRFVDIGELPSGFTRYSFDAVYLREFTLTELKLLYVGMHSNNRPINHIIRAIQMCCSIDVLELTDGDFEFVMAWLRKNSYPKAPLLVNWKCMQHNIVYKDDRTFYTGPPLTEREMHLKGLEGEICKTNNVEIVNKYRTQVEALDDGDELLPYDDLDFPRVSTLSDFHAHVKENPHDRHIAECCRWLREGNTFKEKLEVMYGFEDNDTYERILECKSSYHHGIVEVMQLRCRVCDHTWEHQTAPRLLSFFADNTEEDIFKIQYNLLSEFGMQPDMNMPAKLFLYNYSSLAKDRQNAAERANGFTPLG
jgi:hypothetical protein